jgi:hypothetical protein
MSSQIRYFLLAFAGNERDVAVIFTKRIINLSLIPLHHPENVCQGWLFLKCIFFLYSSIFHVWIVNENIGMLVQSHFASPFTSESSAPFQFIPRLVLVRIMMTFAWPRNVIVINIQDFILFRQLFLALYWHSTNNNGSDNHSQFKLFVSLLSLEFSSWICNCLGTWLYQERVLFSFCWIINEMHI